MKTSYGQRVRLAWGLGCAALVFAIGWVVWGRQGGAAAGVFGLVATAVQLLAARAMARTGQTPSVDHLKVYAIGMLLRLSGVLLLAVAVGLDRTIFPPLASATGYLGTVLPLLYLETRLSR